MTSCLSFTGVGNSAFPLLDLDPTATVYCCDFSQRAVSLVESRRAQLPLDKANRIRPFVCDVSREPMANTHIPPGCVDVCTMVFVLSAIAPERMPDAIRNVSSVMRTGGQGRVLLRDYAAGDLAQTRLGTRDGRKLGDNFYVRGDGTRAYYFENRFIKRLFTDRGMPLEELQVHERAITNRGKGQRMERRWVQCIFASAEVPGRRFHRRRRRRNPSGRKGHARRRRHAPRRLRVQRWRVHRRSWTSARKVKRRKRSSPNATGSSWRNL